MVLGSEIRDPEKTYMINMRQMPKNFFYHVECKNEQKRSMHFDH
jgi:ribosomal protein S27E